MGAGALVAAECPVLALRFMEDRAFEYIAAPAEPAPGGPELTDPLRAWLPEDMPFAEGVASESSTPWVLRTASLAWLNSLSFSSSAEGHAEPDGREAMLPWLAFVVDQVSRTGVGDASCSIQLIS